MNTLVFLFIEHAKQRAEMAARHADELASAVRTMDVPGKVPAEPVAASAGDGRPVTAPGVAGARKRGQ